MNRDLWTQAALGDVVESWTVGRTPPRTKPEFFTQTGGTPWVKAEDVKGGTLRETAERLSEAGGSQLQLIPKDAVLITTAGTIGKTAVAGQPVFCNQAVQALSFRGDTILPLYGYYVLRYHRPLLEHLANGTTIPHISKGALQSIPIRYPPIHVQQRMIAQMRMPETLCEQAERLRELLKRYLLSLTLQEARRAEVYLPVGELLAEAPLTGLRAKTSPTGNGIPLVSRLSGGVPSLTELEGCPRVQVSENQVSRYCLRPMDILLRSTEPSAGVRGALVAPLPEDALAGGNLIRLRLRPSRSPAWLLAWLLGPGGGGLYVDGKLQKQFLPQYRVPVPKDLEDFERRFFLYLALEEKAARFADRAGTLCDSVLRLVFSHSAAEGSALDRRTGAELDRALSRLSEPVNLFLRELSQFQRELYHLLLQSEEGQPVHALLKRTKRGLEQTERAGGIQDALAAFALFEQFGLVEREIARKIPLSPGDSGTGEQVYLMDHNGRPVLIDAYKPAEDIFEEGAYAAGTGEDTKL